jgi:hypothetical protein
LWRDQIQIFLAPGRMDAVRFSRGLKPAQIAKVTARCQPTQEGSAWQSVAQELEKNLMNQAKAELFITLSNHFVRYVTLPPQAEISTPEEVKSYATFRMREVYGERINAWVLSISEWNPINGAICAAIPRDLLTQLEAMAERHQCKLGGIEPYLASVYDHWRKPLSGNKLYLALIEAGRICIALRVNGVWHNIRNQKILYNAADELLAALEQEAILSGAKEASELVHLFAPEHPQLTLPQDCGWHIVPVQTAHPALAHYPSALANQNEMNQCPA